MKPPFPFIRLGILALAWMILGSYAPAHPSADKNSAQTYYYWYWQVDDTYIDYNSTAGECTFLTNYTGYYISTESAGGTRIANGYISNAYPHNFFPSVILYQH